MQDILQLPEKTRVVCEILQLHFMCHTSFSVGDKVLFVLTGLHSVLYVAVNITCQKYQILFSSANCLVKHSVELCSYLWLSFYL